MDPQILVLLFLLAGIALIFLELFVPSGGAIAVVCASCFFASAYYAYQSWYENHPVYWWLFVCSGLILIPASVITAFQLLIRSPIGNRILMAAPTLEEVTPYVEEQARLESLIGQRGRALNLMTPGGMVLVNGERLHASSEGLLIEADETVEVVAVRGMRIIVRPASTEAREAPIDLLDQPGLADNSEEPIDPWSLDRSENP